MKSNPPLQSLTTGPKEPSIASPHHERDIGLLSEQSKRLYEESGGEILDRESDVIELDNERSRNT